MLKGIIDFIVEYKYIVVPFCVWFFIQLFKQKSLTLKK